MNLRQTLLSCLVGMAITAAQATTASTFDKALLLEDLNSGRGSVAQIDDAFIYSGPHAVGKVSDLLHELAAPLRERVMTRFAEYEAKVKAVESTVRDNRSLYEAANNRITSNLLAPSADYDEAVDAAIIRAYSLDVAAYQALQGQRYGYGGQLVDAFDMLDSFDDIATHLIQLQAEDDSRVEIVKRPISLSISRSAGYPVPGTDNSIIDISVVKNKGWNIDLAQHEFEPRYAHMALHSRGHYAPGTHSSPFDVDPQEISESVTNHVNSVAFIKLREVFYTFLDMAMTNSEAGPSS